jgi:signal transduction histidine kinase/ligand-binding sensor domain-containing protein/DNA-binding response OmpR family regulator
MIGKFIYRAVFLILLNIITSFTQFSSGQSLEAASDIRFDRISADQGLSQSSVFSLAQDKKGFIWMGTRDGLNRFDGYDFISYKNNPQDTNSLSNNEITKIYVNTQGNLWIGTRGGGLNYYDQALNRFTRYENLNYENIVRDIFETGEGPLWVGTSEGLLKSVRRLPNGRYIFTNLTNSATYTSEGQPIPKTKANKSVISINCLSPGKLLIGTEYGLFSYDVGENVFHKINLGESDNSIVTSTLIEKNGTIWVGTFNGLVKLIPKNAKSDGYNLEFYNTRQNNLHRLLQNRIEAITRDCFGNVWAGTHGGGLVKIEKDGKTGIYINNASDSQSLADNIVNSLLMDNGGVLWIGSESQGCNKLDLYRKKFVHIHNIPNNSNSLCSNSVTAIAGSDEGVVWIGSAVKGLDKLTYNHDGTYRIEHFNDIPINSGLTVNEVISLFQDKDDVLWIGTGSNAITRYKKGEGFRSFPINGYVFAIHQDKLNHLWLGTWGQGLCLLDRDKGSVKRFSNVPGNFHSLSSDKVLAIFDDTWGNLWVGTKAGGINVEPLAKLSQGKNEFQSFKHNENDFNSLVHNDVYCITQDKNGNIWLGTGGGLCRVIWPKGQPVSGKMPEGKIQFESYLEKDGLPNGMIFGIVEDRHGNLWLSTNNGLSMFDPNTKVFVNYNVNDGLQANEFHANAYMEDKLGNMYFGGVNGLTVFNPDDLKDNPCIANVVITSFKVFNKVIKPGVAINGRQILDCDITQTKNIVLTYKDKEITLNFAAMHYANPQRVSYAYRLLGFNDKWQTIDGGNRSVTYTNLDDGKYTFQVKATNNDGKWNETPLEVKITMLPPFWRKPWFYLIYAVIIVFLLYVFRKYSLIAVKEKNRLAIERLEHKKQLELSHAKMRFFTNVSHEIRTPLTLISDPLNQVISNGNLDEGSRKSLSLVSNNVGRLLNMVNQLLQLRNIDLGSVKLKISEIQFIPFLKEITGHFEQQSNLRKIKFEFNSDLTDSYLYLDQEMISTVFYNLLSNAFKFTPENGSVSVNIYRYKGRVSKMDFFNIWRRFSSKRQVTNWVAVEIVDNGKGIPHRELRNIFHRFYQANDPGSLQHAGSGIGLALVKEYVGLHKGQVKLVSKPGKGSIFTVYLRTGNQHFKEGQFIVDDEKDAGAEAKLNGFGKTTGTYDYEKVIRDTRAVKDNTPLILVIEDDVDLANYISEHLSKNYIVEIAFDGKNGLKKADNLMPELIISDVMLPEMNGLQLCKKLKNEIETSHIPIILLTARTAEENVMEGYEHGADIYMPKPFNIEVLAKQVRMLIESRARLRHKYCQQLVLEPTDITITSTDERFIKQLMEVTDSHIADPEFDVARLVDAMSMSHTVILRKVKALTSMSLVDFIKEQRLKKAALILQKGKISIAEVGYMVGFSDPKYFSKCFIKEFGKTPTEYCNEFQLSK